MSKYSNEFQNYVMCLENVFGQISGIILALLKDNNPNKELIKQMLLSIFTQLPDNYFKEDGGSTLEVNKLLKYLKDKDV